MRARFGVGLGRYVRRLAAAQLRDREPRSFAMGAETIPVRVRESPRARWARIVVAPRRPLEAIVPLRATDRDVDAFLEEKRRWIETKVAAARTIAAREPRLGLARPGVVWLGGEPFPVERRNGQRSFARLDGGRLVLAGSREQAGAALERWYRREARTRIGHVVERQAARIGVVYRSIGIRDQRTRWGSCSPRRHLSFSWRLLLAPPPVLEYLVVHEVCHLREPNHGKRFWRLLERARPGWQEQSRWLNEHEHELHEYDPASAVGPAR
jgi:predicted metal-dependent hydrolase